MGNPLKLRRFAASVTAVAVVLTLAIWGGFQLSSSSAAHTNGKGPVASSAGASTSAARTKAGHRGRSLTIGWLDAQVSAPIQTRYYDLAKAAAAKLGWKIDLQDINGNVAAASTDMAGLLANHVSAILTSAIEPSWITQQLVQAKKQGVPVIQIGGAVGPNPNAYKSQFAGVYVENETQLAVPVADAMKRVLAGGGQWGAILTPLIYDSAARFAAVKSALSRVRGVKLVATANVTLTDRVSTAASDIQSMLEAHPNIKAIFGALDFVSLAANEALKETHLAGKVKVYSFYTEPGNKTLMEQRPATLTEVSDGNQAETVLVGLNQLVNKLILKRKIQFAARPLMPYFYKDYTAAEMRSIVGDQGPVPFAKMLAPYVAQWKHEGVLAK